MKEKDIAATISNAIAPDFERLGLVPIGHLVWKRRTAQGVFSIKIDVYKKKYMPKDFMAFSCSFCQCNFQIWPLLNHGLRFGEFECTYGSSIFHLKGRDDGSMLDGFRRRRLRSGDYGFSDLSSLQRAIDLFFADFLAYIVPFYRSTSDYRDLAALLDSGSKKWNESNDSMLGFAINALVSEGRVGSTRSVESGPLAFISNLLFPRTPAQAQRQAERLLVLNRFSRMIGSDQALLNSAGALEQNGSYSDALLVLQQAKIANHSNEFTDFRIALLYYRAERMVEAKTVLEAFDSSSIYSELAITLLAKICLESGDDLGLGRCIGELNERFFRSNGYREDVSEKQIKSIFL